MFSWRLVLQYLQKNNILDIFECSNGIMRIYRGAKLFFGSIAEICRGKNFMARSIILFIGFQFIMIFSARANMDSTGIRKINGKIYVLHQIEKGQGLYGIAKRYGTTVAKIQEANKNMGSTLTVGQVLMVPYGKPIKNTGVKETEVPKNTVKKEDKLEKPTNTKTVSDNSADREPIYHTVTKKETLYQIAVNHKITVEQLNSWNKLEGGLKEGQKVIVGYKDKVHKGKTVSNTETTVKTTTKDKTTKTKEKNNKVRSNGEEETQYSNKPRKEVSESGMATWVDDGSIKTEVHLAMHKTAPVGTLIKVTNPMNGRYKFVKVIARLPETEENSKIVIKIGKNTADELDIRDKVFRVNMTYSVEVEK
jgi:LysM repeat protein